MIEENRNQIGPWASPLLGRTPKCKNNPTRKHNPFFLLFFLLFLSVQNPKLGLILFSHSISAILCSRKNALSLFTLFRSLFLSLSLHKFCLFLRKIIASETFDFPGMFFLWIKFVIQGFIFLFVFHLFLVVRSEIGAERLFREAMALVSLNSMHVICDWFWIWKH